MKKQGDKVYVLVSTKKGVVVEEMVITEVVTQESPFGAGLYECENGRIIIRSNGDYIFINQVEAVYQQSVFLKTNTTQHT